MTRQVRRLEFEHLYFAQLGGTTTPATAQLSSCLNATETQWERI
jgi:hypothetical protein